MSFFLLIVYLQITFIATNAQCTLTSPHHIVVISNEPYTKYQEPFVHKILSSSQHKPSINNHHIIVDCIQIIHQNHTNYITKTQTNCHRTPATSDITNIYPITHKYINTAINLFPMNTNIIKTILIITNTTNINIFHIPFSNKTSYKIHQIAAITHHIFCDSLNQPKRRHLLQLTPTSSPTSFKPTVGPPPTTITPTAEVTLIPTVQPTINPTTTAPTLNTLSPTLNTNTPTANTNSPTEDTLTPSTSPTVTGATLYPSQSPSTNFPTNTPSQTPIKAPTINPTLNPTNVPIMNPSVSPSLNPVSAPTIHPSINPTNAPVFNCPQICDILNVTLTMMNETDVECIEERNCECKEGIISMKFKYLGASTASDIIFYYVDNDEICHFEEVKYNEVIVCDIENTEYTMFPSKTVFRITYFDDSDDDDSDCNGYIDTSCSYDIFGSLSKGCEYLQIIQYTDYVNGVCYHDVIPKLIPNQHQTLDNYWKIKTISSDSSDSNRRRTLILNEYYVSSSSSSSSSSSINNKCFESDSVSSDSSSEDTDISIQSTVCLTYKIHYFDAECTDLNSILLPLCTNSSDLTADDLDGLIMNISPNTLSAKGVDEGILGILISFNESNDRINAFKLCLRNVSTYNGIETVEITDYAQIENQEHFEICDNSDGLPCLNFVFKEVVLHSDDLAVLYSINGNNNNINILCDCNTALILLNVRYEGTEIADSIQLRYNRAATSVLCVFNNVFPGDILICNASQNMNNNYNKFGYKTFVDISTSNGGDCLGRLWTQCIQNKNAYNILNTMDSGCNKLRIIGWIDSNNGICNETSLTAFTHYVLSRSKYNALMSDVSGMKINKDDVIQVFGAFDISLQAVLIFIGVGIMCGLVWVGCICLFGIYYDFMMNDDFPVIINGSIKLKDGAVINFNGVQREKEKDVDIVDVIQDKLDEYFIDNNNSDITPSNYQESMKRHKFDRESMQSFDTLKEQKIKLKIDDKETLDSSTNNQQKIEEIDPNDLYQMAQLFSQSDSDHR